jgi:hypothetical protein
MQATVWVRLHQTLIVQDLEQFLKTLEHWSDCYPYAPLQEYLQRLTHQLNEFDWDQLPQTVAEFQPLLEELAKQVESWSSD